MEHVGVIAAPLDMESADSLLRAARDWPTSPSLDSEARLLAASSGGRDALLYLAATTSDARLLEGLSALGAPWSELASATSPTVILEPAPPLEFLQRLTDAALITGWRSDKGVASISPAHQR
ncbi:hypothetical protein GCM10027515_12870 [Schumannella luteola]